MTNGTSVCYSYRLTNTFVTTGKRCAIWVDKLKGKKAEENITNGTSVCYSYSLSYTAIRKDHYTTGAAIVIYCQIMKYIGSSIIDYIGIV